jgi:hypothetical protein
MRLNRDLSVLGMLAAQDEQAEEPPMTKRLIITIDAAGRMTYENTGMEYYEVLGLLRAAEHMIKVEFSDSLREWKRGQVGPAETGRKKAVKKK